MDQAILPVGMGRRRLPLPVIRTTAMSVARPQLHPMIGTQRIRRLVLDPGLLPLPPLQELVTTMSGHILLGKFNITITSPYGDLTGFAVTTPLLIIAGDLRRLRRIVTPMTIHPVLQAQTWRRTATGLFCLSLSPSDLIMHLRRRSASPPPRSSSNAHYESGYQGSASGGGFAGAGYSGGASGAPPPSHQPSRSGGNSREYTRNGRDDPVSYRRQ